jgi:hypothetical protein
VNFPPLELAVHEFAWHALRKSLVARSERRSARGEPNDNFPPRNLRACRRSIRLKEVR